LSARPPIPPSRSAIERGATPLGRKASERFTAGLALFTFLLGAHCGGSGSPAGGPDVGPTDSLVGLSSIDEAALCDWFAQQWGGYGGSIGCQGSGGAVLSAPQDRASCEDNLSSWGPACPLDVGQFESCVEWETKNVCLVGTLSASMLPSECQTANGLQCAGYKPPIDGGAD
jgi:hypothetical protein